MKTNIKTMRSIKQAKTTDPRQFALKLALALSGSRAGDVSDFEFYDAQGQPLKPVTAGKKMILVRNAEAA